jgi:hypothetical protein
MVPPLLFLCGVFVGLVFSGEPPVFDYVPVLNIVAQDLYAAGNFCGDTTTIINTTNTTEQDEVFVWQVYNSTADIYEDRVPGKCVEVPHGLGVQTEEDLGSDGVIVFRLCASNANGTTCSPVSSYRIETNTTEN